MFLSRMGSALLSASCSSPLNAASMLDSCWLTWFFLAKSSASSYRIPVVPVVTSDRINALKTTRGDRNISVKLAVTWARVDSDLGR